MTFTVTAGAERNQIVRHVPTQLAPTLHVMNLQVRIVAAALAKIYYFTIDKSPPSVFTSRAA